MTLPASGAISFSDVNTEILASATAQISLNDSLVRTTFGQTSGSVDMNTGHGKSYVIAGNSGVITSGSSYTLPARSGPKINVIAIAGGGGGGGGSGRTYWSGFTTGGGGGGSGGAAYATNVTVTPGQTVTFSIGGNGGAGAYNMGSYAPYGSDGGSGGTTTVYVNGNAVAQATGGGGGSKAPTPNPGGGGGISVGSNALSSIAGGYGEDSVYTEGGGRGGTGAAGYTINTSQTNIGSIIGYGSYGSEGENQAGGTGTVYGAGGTGGGTVQSDRHNYARMFAGAGSAGAVYIWWF
jgi:hypothetical protein